MDTLYSDGVERLAAERLFETKMDESDYVCFILLYSYVLTNNLWFRIHPPVQIRAILFHWQR